MLTNVGYISTPSTYKKKKWNLQDIHGKCCIPEFLGILALQDAFSTLAPSQKILKKQIQ